MKDDKIDRRNVLKGIGGGIGAVGLSTSVSFAATKGQASDPITILEKGRKMALARQLSQTEQFERLHEKATELGYTFEWDFDNLQAGRVEADDFRREVVSYEFSGTGDDTKAGIIIGRDLDRDVVEFAYFDVEHYGANGLFERLDRYEAATSVATTQVGGTTPDEGIQKQTMEPSPEEVQQLVDGLQQAQDGVSTQWDIPDYINITTCSGCYYACGLFCRTVCGGLGGFACGLLGITVIGAVGCVTFVKAVCWVAEKASGCGDAIGAAICRHPTIDVCDSNQSGSLVDFDEIPYL